MKYTDIHIIDMASSSVLTAQLMQYAKNCSFQGSGTYLAEIVENGELQGWERVFCVLSSDKIIGFGALMRSSCVDDEGHTPWLDFLFVDEKYRNRNIGRAIVYHICQYAKNLGFSTVFLCTLSHANYYHRLGFVSRAFSFFYNGAVNEEAIQIMEKSLVDSDAPFVS